MIGTGHLSLELGGPRQFGPHGPDPEFDAKAVEWIANGDIDGCLSEVTLDSLHAPGNATHGFMDFMLMMGLAGLQQGRLRRQPRSVPHDGGLLHLVPERGGRVSKYLVNKFLFTVDRDPDLVERYREDPAGTVAWWEAERANQILNCVAGEASTWLQLTDAEREALAVTTTWRLFEMGAHPFLTLTLWIAMFERDVTEPLAMQRNYAAKLAHIQMPYPDITT